MIIAASAAVLLSSCVSQKKYADLEAQQQETQDRLNTATVKLNSCLEEKAGATAKANALEDQVADLRRTNADLIETKGNLTTLTTKGATNLEKSLESLKEKDLQIKTLRDAVTRKDSVTLALVTSLKGALGNMADEDIEINVATVVNAKPDIEFMVEGHTDNVPIKNAVLEDNWDLSAKRATSVVRILQDEYGVPPQRMTAAGRSYYIPVASNDTAEGRAKNRRTRIVVLPKLDQFYSMVKEGMDEASKK